MPRPKRSTKTFSLAELRAIVKKAPPPAVELDRQPLNRSGLRLAGYRPAILGLLAIIMVVSAVRIILIGRQWTREDRAWPTISADQSYQQSIQLAQAGDWPAAKVYLEQALKQQFNLNWQGQLAVINYQLGDYDRAIQGYQRLVEAGQDLAFAYNGLGNCYRDKGEHLTAEANYQKAIEVEPGYVVAYTNLAIMFYDLGETIKAKEILKSGINTTQNSDIIELQKRLALSNP